MKFSIAFGIVCTSAGIASAQTINPDFGGCYSIRQLGSVPGVPVPYGGVTFKYDDPDMMLIGGAANQDGGAIYSIRVTRDAEGVIDGFDGTAELFATAPNIDGGLTFGPGNVLFFTRFSQHAIGQIKPLSTGPDKEVSLAPFFAGSTGSVQFVPAGFPGEGRMKASSYNASLWADLAFSADGSGTYNITGAPTTIGIGGGPEGLVFVQPGNPGFTKHSVLVSEYNTGKIACYDLDASGDPILATRRELISGLTGAEGGTRDPRNGHFLFNTFNGGDRVILVTGFNLACRPNINGDCYVDDADFVLFAVMYNILDCGDPSMPAGCPADFNDDGLVDDSDFVIFVDAYNRLICQ
ncbi:MAG: hypothetical protein KF691_15300 [Phycisphaeraceae bacterium]|nr:hypothetical protein [Phycisphaeraceae bacterium]